MLSISQNRPFVTTRFTRKPAIIQQRSSVISRAGSVKELESSDEFNAFIGSNDIVIVDFYTSWCGPCKMVAPKVEALADELDGNPKSNVKFAKLKLDGATNGKELASKYNIKAIPTFISFKNGAVDSTVTGSNIENIRKLAFCYV